MHLPADFAIGPVIVHVHMLLETLAYPAGFALHLRLRRRRVDPISDATRMIVVAGAAVGAVIGSKLLFLFEDPAATLAALAHPVDQAALGPRGWVLGLLGGKTIVGGLLGGWGGVEIAKRLVHETRRTGDLYVLPLCLGMAIGRVGCFLAGPGDGTWGGPTSLPWGVDPGDGIARHPAPLYEIAVLALIALWASRRRAAREGDLFRGFMALYLAWRLAIEFVKPGDARIALGLTAIQITCAAALAAMAPALPRIFFAPRATPVAAGG